LRRHAGRIKADEVGFLSDYLGQWPRCLRNTISKHTPGAVAMKGMEKIISTSFLMKVPSESFLQLAYREFFDREMDEGGRDAYGGFDFDDPAQREAIMVALSQSEEFRQQTTQKVITGPSSMLDSFGNGVPPGLYWDRRAVVDERWFNTNPNARKIGLSYTPMLLWIPARDRLYTYPGIELGGAVSGNVLTADPEWSLWGPKAPIEAGSYKVLVDLAKSASDLCMFDICVNGGMTTLFTVNFFSSLKLEIPIHVSNDAPDLEFRLFNLTGRKIDIELKEISLSRLE
jgi:hypothetical protein